jgi:hypothetical protein
LKVSISVSVTGCPAVCIIVNVSTLIDYHQYPVCPPWTCDSAMSLATGSCPGGGGGGIVVGDHQVIKHVLPPQLLTSLDTDFK